MYGYNEEQYRLFKRKGMTFIILYSLMYCMLYCIRLNLTNAGAKLMEELSFTSGQIGILSSCLFWGYAIGMLIGGRLSEIVGAKRFILISFFGSFLMNIIMGFMDSFLPMAIVWAVNGFLQALNWPAGCVLAAEWWPSKRRGFAIGLASAFAGFGQALATLTVTAGFALFPGLGYRSAFFFPAAISLVFFLIYLFLTKDSPEKAGLPPYREEIKGTEDSDEKLQKILDKKGPLYPYFFLLKDLKFDMVLLMHVFLGIARYGLLTWVPLYFISKYNVNIMEGLLQSVSLPVGMGFGALILPTVSDKLGGDRMKMIPGAAVVAILSIIALLFLNPGTSLGLVLIEAVLFIAGFCVYAVGGLLNVYMEDVGGRALSGTANGLFGFTGYMGAALQAVFYGFVTEKLGWDMLYISIAVFLTLMMILSILNSKKK